MNPWLSQAVAEAHRQDLIRVAQRRRPAVRVDRAPRPVADPSGQVQGWDEKLGWLLIRVGARLVTQHAQLPPV